MILQKMIWDDTAEYGNTSLFFRGIAQLQGNALHMDRTVTLDTYFNLFSWKKWRTYTNITGVKAVVTLSGEGKVTLVGIKQAEDGERREETLAQEHFAWEEPKAVELCPVTESWDYLYICVEPRKKAVLWEGCFAPVHELPEENAQGTAGDTQVGAVRLGMVICTYHREAEVLQNLTKLSDFAEREELLREHAQVYVIDNGKTLLGRSDIPKNGLPIHIYDNPNFGGSAGFTRGMLEAVIRQQEEAFTHVLLMDDDVLLYPEVITRTIRFLSYIKEEYRENILGGAMLSLENREIQEEGCGYYEVSTGKNRISRQNGLCLADKEAVLRNEEVTDVNFSGWWYSCIPATLIRDGNLPLPLFIHRDDQDYGVRSAREILQLNGVCIWHPSPAGKHADYIHYYDMRNMMIAMMDLDPDAFSVAGMKKYLLSECLKKILGYRYGAAKEMLEGMEDFLKGPEAFLQINPQELHAELLQRGSTQWRSISPEELTEIKTLRDEKHLGILTKLARYLFPMKSVCYVKQECNYPTYLGYRKVVYLSENHQKGYELQQSLAQTFRVIGAWRKVCRNLNTRGEQAKASWIETVKRLKTVEFWENYLEEAGKN